MDRKEILKGLQILFLPLCSILLLYINELIERTAEQNLLAISYQSFFRNVIIYIIYGLAITFWFWLVKGQTKLKLRIYSIVEIVIYIAIWLLTYIPLIDQSLLLFILNNYSSLSIWIGVFFFTLITSYLDLKV